MKGFFVYNSLLIGLMIFSMTFGAGNLIYPLAAGYQAGNMVGWCALGFFVSSIFLPWLGLCAVMVYQGDYRRLLYENLPQTALAEGLIFCSMLLLGPLGCIPRCALTAYAGVASFFPQLSALLWNAGFLGACYFLACKKDNLITVLGRLVSPITIFCLICMILLGIWGPKTLTTLAPKQSVSSSVMGGFYQGCFTFDFLAMVFYSRVIYQVALELLSHKVQNSSELPRKTFIFLLSSAAIAAVFFSLVYGGMMLAAAYNSGAVTVTSQEQLIAAFAAVLLGEKFAFLYTIIVTLACFATSFALLVVFADYVNMVSDGKIAYKQALVLSTLVAFGLANLNFGQITQLMGPLMIFIYPILIPMVLWVLAKKMAGR